MMGMFIRFYCEVKLLQSFGTFPAGEIIFCGYPLASSLEEAREKVLEEVRPRFALGAHEELPVEVQLTELDLNVAFSMETLKQVPGMPVRFEEARQSFGLVLWKMIQVGSLEDWIDAVADSEDLPFPILRHKFQLGVPDVNWKGEPNAAWVSITIDSFYWRGKLVAAVADLSCSKKGERPPRELLVYDREGAFALAFTAIALWHDGPEEVSTTRPFNNINRAVLELVGGEPILRRTPAA